MDKNRGLNALAGAAAAGGLATSTGIVVALLAPSVAGGLPPLVQTLTGVVMAAFLVLLIAIFATLVFAIGLCVIGLPAWVALSRLGCLTPAVAALAGAILTGVTVAAIAFAMGGLGSGPAVFATLMTLPGGISGWTLQRIAYGRPARS